MYLKGKGSARMMASFGGICLLMSWAIAVYGGLECVVERIMGKKNILTNAIAGCGVGLVTGSKRGPQVGGGFACLVLECLFELFRFCCVWSSYRYVYSVIHLYACVSLNKELYSSRGERPRSCRIRFVSITEHSYSPRLLTKRWGW